MILQRTLAALAAAGIFGASAGCLWAYADELPVEGEQLPDTVYATAGNENSVDGAVIYSVDSSNYTEGYSVDLKADKDSLMSVDTLIVSGKTYQLGDVNNITPTPIFGLGEQRSDGYYIIIDYIDDLGDGGQIVVGPLDTPLYSLDNVSDEIEITSDCVYLSRHITYLSFPFDAMNNSVDYPGWKDSAIPDLYYRTQLYNSIRDRSVVSFNIKHSEFSYFSNFNFTMLFNSGRYGNAIHCPDLYSYYDIPYRNYSDLVSRLKNYSYDLLLFLLKPERTVLPFSGSLPANVQTLKIFCAGNVSADISNRPSVVPSVIGENGLPAVFSVAGKYVDFATSNPVSAVCFSSILVPIGIGVFKALRGI